MTGINATAYRHRHMSLAVNGIAYSYSVFVAGNFRTPLISRRLDNRIAVHHKRVHSSANIYACQKALCSILCKTLVDLITDIVHLGQKIRSGASRCRIHLMPAQIFPFDKLPEVIPFCNIRAEIDKRFQRRVAYLPIPTHFRIRYFNCYCIAVNFKTTRCTSAEIFWYREHYFAVIAYAVVSRCAALRILKRPCTAFSRPYCRHMVNDDFVDFRALAISPIIVGVCKDGF